MLLACNTNEDKSEVAFRLNASNSYYIRVGSGGGNYQGLFKLKISRRDIISLPPNTDWSSAISIFEGSNGPYTNVVSIEIAAKNFLMSLPILIIAFLHIGGH